MFIYGVIVNATIFVDLLYRIYTSTAFAMINSHTHIFSIQHTPVKFLPWYLRLVAKVAVRPWMIHLLTVVKLKGPAYLLKKYYNFMKIGAIGTQADIFHHLQGFYPQGTKFAVLSMDMEYIGAGEVPENFYIQLDGLAKLKSAYPNEIYPFVFAHPERKDIFKTIKKYIEEHHFSGIKLYPALGYFPFDPRLKDVYAYAEEKQIPIMTHCTRGGVYYQGKLTTERRTDPSTNEMYKLQKNSVFTDNYSDPDRYLPLLEAHPNLKICFAHYGGWSDWDNLLSESWHNKVPDSWFYKINQLILNSRFPNVYTDVSYTLVRSDLFSVLKTYLETNELIRNHVLFGTDYYMTEIEGSERFFSMNLRGFLGERLWHHIAEANPARYLNL